jgi:riboflavin kinase / FMN adenylyltransferase
MKISHSIDEIEFKRDSIVTVGTFDGVHLGHQSILKEVTDRSKASAARSVVVTFDPHPREVVGRGPVEYLSTLPERLAKIGRYGLDEAVVINFTYEFSRLSPREFYEFLAKRIGLREVIVGYDHLFGKDRTGGIEELVKIGTDLGFSAMRVPPVIVRDTAVSSSVIRTYLREGNVGAAGEFMGEPYAIRGFVTEGDSRGKQLGFPTANIQTNQQKKLIPAMGVYAVSVLFNDKRWYGMMNIGVRPTFKSDQLMILEVHIFDFNQNIYNKELEIQFLTFVRPEKKFASKDELIIQLQHDRKECLKYLSGIYHHS